MSENIGGAMGNPETKPVQVPTMGRIIHVTFENNRGNLVTRPAIVVQVWSPTCVNAIVFLDGVNDSGREDGGCAHEKWVTSITYSEQKSPLTWCWPNRD